MGVRVRDLLMGELGELRYEPIEKGIRGIVEGRCVVDSQRSMLLWEPKRIVPSHAVPVEDVDGDLVEQPVVGGDPDRHAAETDAPRLGDRPVVIDRIAFFNERVDLRVDGVRLERPVTPWSRR